MRVGWRKQMEDVIEVVSSPLVKDVCRLCCSSWESCWILGCPGPDGCRIHLHLARRLTSLHLAAHAVPQHSRNCDALIHCALNVCALHSASLNILCLKFSHFPSPPPSRVASWTMRKGRGESKVRKASRPNQS